MTITCSVEDFYKHSFATITYEGATQSTTKVMSCCSENLRGQDHADEPGAGVFRECHDGVHLCGTAQLLGSFEPNRLN